MRPSWDEYFLKIAEVVGSRSTCEKGLFTGCVIVDSDNCILSTGYAGSPSGLPHCDEAGHDFIEIVSHSTGKTSTHCVRTAHAEANAIATAARKGISLKNGRMYCILEPCWECAKLIHRAGIIEVIAKFPYHAAERTRSLFRLTEINLTVEGEIICKKTF